MNKKGSTPSVLNEVMAIILTLVSIVILFFVFMSMLGPYFKSETGSLGCALTVNIRDIFVSSIMTLWSVISPIISLALAINPMTSATNSIGLGIEAIPSSGQGSAGESYLKSMNLNSQIAYFMINTIVSKIPFSCDAVSNSFGTLQKPYSADEMSKDLAAVIPKWYSLLGEGKKDPLLGIDPPNPRIFSIYAVHLDKEITFLDVYNNMTKSIKNWQFGEGHDMGVFLYCYVKDSGLLGDDYESLSNVPDNFKECKIKDARIYIMFKDYHPYDFLAYGSSVCGGKINDDYLLSDFSLFEPVPFNLKKDVMVVCVEKMAVGAVAVTG